MLYNTNFGTVASQNTDFGTIDIVSNKNNKDFQYNKNFILSVLDKNLRENKNINLYPFPSDNEEYVDTIQHLNSDKEYHLKGYQITPKHVELINLINNYNDHLSLISAMNYIKKEIKEDEVESLQIEVYCKLLPVCNDSDKHFSFTTNIKLFDNAKWKCSSVFHKNNKVTKLTTVFKNE
jgi:hypothetical protein